MFSSARSPVNLNLKIRNVVIAKPEDEYVKLLGVLIDDRLNFDAHVDNLCTKLRRACGVLFKMSSVLPKYILRMLYNSIVLPHLVYCVEIWGGTSNYNMQRISRLQNRVVRLLGDGDLQSIYSIDNILLISYLRDYFTMISKTRVVESSCM